MTGGNTNHYTTTDLGTMPVSCLAMACAAVVGPEVRFFDMWLSLARAPVVGDIVVCGSAGAVALGLLWHESPW